MSGLKKITVKLSWPEGNMISVYSCQVEVEDSAGKLSRMLLDTEKPHVAEALDTFIEFLLQ
jgi:hypothetical protein